MWINFAKFNMSKGEHFSKVISLFLLMNNLVLATLENNFPRAGRVPLFTALLTTKMDMLCRKALLWRFDCNFAIPLKTSPNFSPSNKGQIKGAVGERKYINWDNTWHFTGYTKFFVLTSRILLLAACCGFQFHEIFLKDLFQSLKQPLFKKS